MPADRDQKDGAAIARVHAVAVVDTGAVVPHPLSPFTWASRVGTKDGNLKGTKHAEERET